jgi:hypothetical protein
MNCKATTTSGTPCKMPATKGGRYCFTHSPATRTAQAQARKRGGENRHTPHAGNPEAIPAKIASLTDAGQILNYTLAELLIMDNGIPRARALLALYDSYVKAFEIGELEKRIQALEELRK